MRNVLSSLICSLLFFSATTHADSVCEAKIRNTGMVFSKVDPTIICKDNPSKQTQDCIVEILTKGRGRLRNSDFMEVSAVCWVDPSPGIRSCVLKSLDKPWNDKAYQGVKVVGTRCLAMRKERSHATR